MTGMQNIRLATVLCLALVTSANRLLSVGPGGDKPIVIGDGKSVFVAGDFKFIIPRKDNSILIAPLGKSVSDEKGVLVRYKDDNGPKPLCGDQRNCLITVHYASDNGDGEMGEIFFFHAASHRDLAILIPSGQFQLDPNANITTFIQHGIKIKSVEERGHPAIVTKGMAEIRIRYLEAAR